MFARTQRLTLRPGWAEDAPAVARAIAHESVVTKLSRAPWPYGLGDARGFLEARAAAPLRDVFCLILAHDGGAQPRLVGGIGIHPGKDGHELGYWLTPEAWGRGYATEAGGAMLGIARHALGLRRLIAGHWIDNPASGRVLVKLGFVPTGRVEPRASRAQRRDVACAIYERELVDEDRPAMPIAA